MYNIIIGLIFLIGGLSGRLVLLGTSSSKLLAALGAGLMAWGAFQEFKRRST